jgi:hypothetical protein
MERAEERVTGASSATTSKKAMAAFDDNKTVVKYIESLYAYLKERPDEENPATNLEWTGPKNG